VWRKDQNSNWQNLIFQEELGSSVNCISWAPFEYGLILAAGTIDGRIYTITYNKKDGQWTTTSFVGHAEGVNGVCWAPSALPAAQ
jgi:protein transport protein SEC13